MIEREAYRQLGKKLKPGKVLLLMGARRTGKTTVLKAWAEKQAPRPLFLNGEDMDVHRLLANRTRSNYALMLGEHKTLVIDEAQNIPDAGMALKFIVDEFPDVAIVATGSSALDLNQQMGQPLTGRRRTVFMDPVSLAELHADRGLVEWRGMLPSLLVYGCFPEVITLKSIAEKQEYLNDLVSDYLLRDILGFEGIRSAGKIRDLLRLLAWQQGSEVSLNELGRQLAISKNTVDKYLDLLAKCFIVRPLGAFSGNLRKEVSKSQKWYFIDNGIRNALISDLRPLAQRQDAGILWESFALNERIKWQHQREYTTNNHFWRTYDQQEIDFLEADSGRMHAFEFKWNPERKAKVPVAFSKAYPAAGFRVIHPDNISEWLLGGDGL